MVFFLLIFFLGGGIHFFQRISYDEGVTLFYSLLFDRFMFKYVLGLNEINDAKTLHKISQFFNSTLNICK